MSRAMGTGMGPWVSISQHSPPSACPRKQGVEVHPDHHRAGRGPVDEGARVGHRLTVGCAAGTATCTGTARGGQVGGIGGVGGVGIDIGVRIRVGIGTGIGPGPGSGPGGEPATAGMWAGAGAGPRCRGAGR